MLESRASASMNLKIFLIFRVLTLDDSYKLNSYEKRVLVHWVHRGEIVIFLVVSIDRYDAGYYCKYVINLK